MLRVETQELDGSLICRLEGRFTGDGAEQVRQLVTRWNSKLELVVDLTEILFIDSIGGEVLSFLKKLGAQFIAETSYSRHICEWLELPMERKKKTDTQLPGNGTERFMDPADDSRY